jgi:predicted dehydrogenase
MVPSPKRVAVIGLGVMGARHARAVAAHAGATLAAVVDVAEDARTAISKELDCAAYASIRDIIGKVDAAIVAVPTALHGTFALGLLDGGIACLVEKPFVASRDEGARVIAAAQARKVALQVGHIERFNPATIALLARAHDPSVLRTITARRISAASARVTDIDVIIDLMVHDIDVVLALKRQPVTDVTASGNADHAQAILTFRDGTTADITASRTQPGRIRTLQATTDKGALEMDYIARTLTENGVTVPVRDHDALSAQLGAFLAAVKGGDVIVSAADAMAVMDVAWRIQAALGLKS